MRKLKDHCGARELLLQGSNKALVIVEPSYLGTPICEKRQRNLIADAKKNQQSKNRCSSRRCPTREQTVAGQSQSAEAAESDKWRDAIVGPKVSYHERIEDASESPRLGNQD